MLYWWEATSLLSSNVVHVVVFLHFPVRLTFLFTPILWLMKTYPIDWFPFATLQREIFISIFPQCRSPEDVSELQRVFISIPTGYPRWFFWLSIDFSLRLCKLHFGDAPLRIVRASKQFVYDISGTEYLDCVNSAAHGWLNSSLPLL